MRTIALIALLILPFIGVSQSKLDSLNKVWLDDSQPDTARLKAVNAMAWKYVFSAPDSTLKISEKALLFAKSVGQRKYEANALNDQGVAYLVKSDYPNALQRFTDALAIYRELEDTKHIGLALNNIGLVYNGQAEYDEALDYFKQSLKVRETIKDSTGIGTSLHVIGNIYQSKGDYAYAMDYYNKSLVIKEKTGDKRGIANTYNNIGLLYKEQEIYQEAYQYFYNSIKIKEEIKDDYGLAVSKSNIGEILYLRKQYEPALDYLNESIEAQKILDDKEGMAINYGHIGNVYRGLNEYEKAMENFILSKEIREEIGDKKGIANVLIGIALNYLAQGKTTQALENAKQALSLSKELGINKETMDAAQILYQAYKAIGNNVKALEAHEEYTLYKDSVSYIQNERELISREFKANYERQALSDSLEYAKQQEIAELEFETELDKARTRQYALYMGLALLLALGLTAFMAYRNKRHDNLVISAQKKKVEEQKELVEEKNQKIWDSITYAQRIQTAILPPMRMMKEALPDSYIIYLPKDLVAGDFFWLEKVGTTTLFAVADCTGHGVPGAIVSVVCHNALNRSVREFGLTEPAQILDKTRELVIETFEKSEEEVKDGMDIALCSYNKRTKKLQYAGANNSLYHITTINGEVDERAVKNETHFVNEIKADRQPIGRHLKPSPFTNHTLKLNTGDSIILFSDGFADQFGGAEGKKYKYKPFKELLLSLYDKPMEEQKALVLQAFNDWKGAEEQIDDVCIMGLRV